MATFNHFFKLMASMSVSVADGFDQLGNVTIVSIAISVHARFYLWQSEYDFNSIL
jgi:hypothetical protein